MYHSSRSAQDDLGKLAAIASLRAPQELFPRKKNSRQFITNQIFDTCHLPDRASPAEVFYLHHEKFLSAEPGIIYDGSAWTCHLHDIRLLLQRCLNRRNRFVHQGSPMKQGEESAGEPRWD